MIITIKLSTGKEIDLTKEEFEELVGKEAKAVYIPYQRWVPYYPTPHNPSNPFFVTCNTGGTNGTK